MSKQCKKCGFINDDGCNFCVKCGTDLVNISIQKPVQQDYNVVSNQQTDDSKANTLGILSLILYFGGSVLTSILTYILPDSLRSYFSSIGGLLPLAGIVIMIVGRVKYPKNTLLKVVMWIYIILIALSLLFIILFAVWCFVMCSTMDMSGCS